MTDQVASLSIEIKAETADAKQKLTELQSLSRSFGRQITNAFTSAISNGKGLGDVLSTLAQNLSEVITNAALTPVSKAAGSALTNLFQGITGFAQGGVFNRGLITPFASGGVVASPTLFPLQNGAGLMGEAGAEAVLPLTRGTDGKLGVKSTGSVSSPSIQINVSTPDTQSFRRSEVQIAAVMSRVVTRGQRNL
jgi:phage-related minor tail protein